MKGLIFIATMIAMTSGCRSLNVTEDPSENVNIEYRFIARVLEIGVVGTGSFGNPLIDYCINPEDVKTRSSGFIVAGNDARYVVKTEILKIEDDGIPFRIGSEWIFIIHSPSMSFIEGVENVLGNIYEIRLFGYLRPGNTVCLYHFESIPFR